MDLLSLFRSAGDVELAFTLLSFLFLWFWSVVNHAGPPPGPLPYVPFDMPAPNIIFAGLTTMFGGWGSWVVVLMYARSWYPETIPLSLVDLAGLIIEPHIRLWNLAWWISLAGFAIWTRFNLRTKQRS